MNRSGPSFTMPNGRAAPGKLFPPFSVPKLHEIRSRSLSRPREIRNSILTRDLHVMLNQQTGPLAVIVPKQGRRPTTPWSRLFLEGCPLESPVFLSWLMVSRELSYKERNTINHIQVASKAPLAAIESNLSVESEQSRLCGVLHSHPLRYEKVMRGRCEATDCKEQSHMP